MDPDPRKPVDPEKPVDPGETSGSRKAADPEKPTVPPLLTQKSQQNLRLLEEPEKPTDPTEPEEPEILIVITPPKGGIVEFDKDGKWKIYSKSRFTGKDSFVIRHPDGNRGIDRNRREAPLGGIEKETLPKTGQANSILMYLAGLFFIVVGIILRKR